MAHFKKIHSKSFFGISSRGNGADSVQLDVMALPLNCFRQYMSGLGVFIAQKMISPLYKVSASQYKITFLLKLDILFYMP